MSEVALKFILRDVKQKRLRITFCYIRFKSDQQLWGWFQATKRGTEVIPIPLLVAHSSDWRWAWDYTWGRKWPSAWGVWGSRVWEVRLLLAVWHKATDLSLLHALKPSPPPRASSRQVAACHRVPWASLPSLQLFAALTTLTFSFSKNVVHLPRITWSAH